MIQVNFINSNGDGYLVYYFEYTVDFEGFIKSVLYKKESIIQFSKIEISFYTDNLFSKNQKNELKKYFDILD